MTHDSGDARSIDLPVDSPAAVRLAQNSMIGLTRGLITVPLSLITTAIILKRLGAESLGIWALLGLFTSPILLFNFGLAWNVTRQVALHRNDASRIQTLVTTALMVLGCVMAALLCGYSWARPCVICWLTGRSSLDPETLGAVLDLSFTVWFVSLTGLSVTAALYGLLKIQWPATSVVMNQVVVTILVFLFLTPTRGVTLLFQAALIAGIIQVTIQFWGLWSVLGRFPVSPSAFSKADAADLSLSAPRYAVMELFHLSFYVLDKWLIAAFLGAGPVGLYELGARLGLIARAVINNLLNDPLLSASAAATASNLADVKLRRLSFYALRYLAVLAVPLVFLTVLEADFVLNIWVGQVDPLATIAVTHLVPSYLANATTWGLLFFLIGSGNIRTATGLGGLAFVLNLALDLAALILRPGLDSVVTANLAASALTVLVVVICQLSASDIRPARFLGSLGRIIVAATVTFLVLRSLPHLCSGERALMAVELALRGILFSGVYAATLWITGELDDQDRYFLKTLGGFLSSAKGR